MENILQAQSDIDAVYTHDDDMAQGVAQAIRNAGRDDEMFLTGVGGSQDAMQQIGDAASTAPPSSTTRTWRRAP